MSQEAKLRASGAQAGKTPPRETRGIKLLDISAFFALWRRAPAQFALRWRTDPVWRAARTRRGPDAPTAVLVGFSRWKTFILDFLPDHNVVTLSHDGAAPLAAMEAVRKLSRPHVFTWSYNFAPDLALFCARHGLPLTHVEDGFLRSLGLGVARSAPASLVFDDRAMHFDRLRPSRLEELLAAHDFDADPGLMRAAEDLAGLMRGRGLSKYNISAARRVEEVLTPGRRRVLALGQVEDDLSIRYGAETPITGNQLVMLAARENPDAQILYRPHPDVTSHARPQYSDPALVADLCTTLGPEFGIADCLDQADLVYTATSLAGFEAALRGKPVVTLGAPFYAGWGITEDRLPIPRRTRRLTALQILAGAYLLYPRYAGVSPEAGPRAILDLLPGLVADQA
ncbi:hypothetical protein [Neomegalonema sp.]|uniref:capsular polysaccharide export protein, LipB/KpsS family n=1 Tax=Neomegalonema sp. TaxID=2039713 RepID=UPI002633DC0E|nr:hypothetical protein [Neomegalonema sp.]MDD2869888.1 hypothetical protein [Neomegalonema sp.]